MARAFEIVFLDVGETLTYAHPSFGEIMARVLNAHGYPFTPEDVVNVEHQVWKDMDARRQQGVVYALSGPETKRFWIDAYGLFVQHLGIEQRGNLPERLVDEFLRFENWRLHPDVMPTIDALVQEGYRLGVISNWEDWLEDLLLFLEVRQHFDLVVFSAKENIAKPDPRLYQRAVEAAGIDPARGVHVGDDPARDVVPARAVGLNPVLIDRKGRYPEVDYPRITDLRQLPDLLARRHG